MSGEPCFGQETGGEWCEVSRRNARSVQTAVGWIFWDPVVVTRYGQLGLEGAQPASRVRARYEDGQGP
ncbi:hypothetical protein V1460_16555 [Streptomyces sp. SCSIO 30461]|uniref:hypothetical protein n=1 Tax=Streptomyces sp. SCSIO 30461 TaxID=3118085 RepID=UPI0030CE4DEB